MLGEPALFSWLDQIPGGASIFSEFMTKNWEPAVKAAKSGDLEGGARLFINGVMGDGAFDKLPEAPRRRSIDSARLLTLPTTSLLEIFTRENARAIKAPTLLLTGEQSPRMFLLIAEELARFMPNVQRGKILGASHTLHGMNPQMYNETVLAFLAKH